MIQGKTWHKFKYEDNVVFSGAIAKEMVDLSDGGRKPIFKVLSFHVHIWLGGIEHDVTESIRCNDGEIFNIYIDEFRDNYIEKRGVFHD